MSHGRPAVAEIPVSLTPSEGWHCSHLYYAFDRAAVARMSAEEIAQGRADMIAALDPEGPQAPERLQTSIVSGHKADFALMLMDPDPLKLDAVHQSLLSSRLGAALTTTWSFTSITEISEYVPTVEQYAEKLQTEGDEKGSPAFEAKLNAYATRLPMMNRQRLTPDFPDWPATCFYPMNKRRDPGANWYMLPFERRNELMAEHALSGRQFAGKVMQLITVGLGLEDWEWGVTLWAKNPEFLTEIVYKMRFDQASAEFAQFGPFLASYVAAPSAMLDHCRIGVE
ncbi:hydrogen peroxide-dependent heme synthase [Lignipirellula cremea]|uniref:Putative heme peroxidase n=1 Tax=Lignipirellula cremea TaxID=2528010 RepID=A0A518DUX8_9BACT|nr:hydrogen peroxide-dependent heme synthase [Lignipirellula cremea]QDU95651.1 putative heme peroxidase [Lignipirellula cremea]